MTVSICTQVYNTKPFLCRCVESVLSQTYTDFEYILIDNGSTDGCREILEEYAAQDKRIHLILFEVNRPYAIWLDIVREKAKGQYIASLDSDDWLDPTFFARLISLAEHKQLDIICTGTAFHVEGQEDRITGARSMPRQIVMEKPEYSAYFPYYHAFFRTVWGKLIRREIFLSADLSVIDREEIINGADTLTAFAWLRQAKRIGIDNSVLHHYLMRKKSVSRVYLPNRFKSNTVLHQDAVDFLSRYGSVSQQNLHFLHIVYANAVYDTLEVLWSSELSPDKKLQEYCTIALHPTTCEAYQDRDEAIDRSKNALIQQILSTAAQVTENNEEFSSAIKLLLPKCGGAAALETILLFSRENALMNALLKDDPDALAKLLLNLIKEKRYTKQYDLGGILQKLAADKLLLSGLRDIVFLRNYGDIYWLVWQGNILEALDQMTGMLLENQVHSSEELFLQLYLSAAAYLEQPTAFVFGKVRLAQLYHRRNQREQYQTIADELSEMGVEQPW